MVTTMDRRGERQELAEPPDAGEVERVEPSSPLRLEFRKPAGNGQAVPVVNDVEQVAAGRAGEMGLVNGVSRPTRRPNALLERLLTREGNWLHFRNAHTRPWLENSQPGYPPAAGQGHETRAGTPPGLLPISPNVQISVTVDPVISQGSIRGNARFASQSFCSFLSGHPSGPNVSASEETPGGGIQLNEKDRRG